MAACQRLQVSTKSDSGTQEWQQLCYSGSGAASSFLLMCFELLCCDMIDVSVPL